MTTPLLVLRVFVGDDGTGGNPLGVFLDGPAIPADERQAVAADLGFSETVFVDDHAAARYRIFTPRRELPFAGHPTVGTAWLLAEGGAPPSVIRPPAGDVPTWREDELTWVRARASWVHPMNLARLELPKDVEALTGPPIGEGSYYPWAWIDQARGIIRSRYFARDVGIAEDEATGAAAVVITDRLGRDLEIRQGRGSLLRTRVAPDGTIDLGGRVALVEEREYRTPRERMPD